MTIPSSLPARDDAPSDVVGSRVLVGIQMVNISRLSTHPVPLTPYGLITVAGQGPTDSNGAGKSSFIAGLSLLHADEQWRLQSGAQAAAELLFTAELAGQEAVHANADRGYIIGVFAPPTVHTTAELDATVLTVWLRINRPSPHLELRWAHRLHLPYGETENERAAGADDLWNALPRSNGRSDLRANRLARTLYGDTVRCVSFLSTSVRASPTANLLAQPLNELSPERIFDAIGALTGLTRELEQEQKARAEEYHHAKAEEEARSQYDEWDDRMATVEAGIRLREVARILLVDARECWRSRCARHLVDGIAERDDIAAELRSNEKTRTQLAVSLDTEKGEVARLADDQEFQRSYRNRINSYNDLKAQLDELRRVHSEAVGRIETLSTRQRELQEKAQAADGLTVEQAEALRRAAEKERDTAQRAKGVTEAALRSARAAVMSAERGEDVAAEQIRALRAEGIGAAPLVDVVTLTEAQRPAWEARLLPYRHAVVVPHGAAAAPAVLAGIRGSLLVYADPGDGPDTRQVDLPSSVHPDFTLATFLAALAHRAGAEPGHIDTTADVHAISGFKEPLTGRAGRIQEAHAALEATVTADEDADGLVVAAHRELIRAQETEEAVRAGAEAADIASSIHRLRAANEANEKEKDGLAAPFAAAGTNYQQAITEKNARDARLSAARHRVATVEKEQDEATRRWNELLTRRGNLDLDGRHSAWGGTVDSARAHILTLTDTDQAMPLGEWDDAADSLAERLRHACFPPGTPAENVPGELNVVTDQRSAARRTQDGLRLIPAVLRIVGTYLTQHAQVDKQQQAEIEATRADKTATLRGAEAALTEARQASAALRGTLATAIKAKLKQVSSEFDRIDKTYGGYGGVLEFPEPESPGDPDKPWRWSVTPKWRRSEGKPPASYRLRGNTAQMDDKAVKLVCAAALAGTGDRPLLLVLDELGRNLGAAHRRDAVALFESIGRDRAVSVVGALQDDMERYAVAASSLYIKLRRSSDTMPYNQAPIIIGSDASRDRVELLADWLTSYRPQPQT